jgi:putative methyltransferase
MTRPRSVYISYLPDLTVHSAVVHVPYIYGVLKCYAEQNDDIRRHYEFAPPLWRTETADATLERISDPDIVGFSIYVWNELNSHRLARMLKERYPDCLVVFGGPQVPNTPSDYLQRHPWVDLLVHGEGEQPFCGLLLEYLEPEPDWHQVRGLSFLVEGKQVFSPQADRLKKLEFPSPYLNGTFDPMLGEVRSENPYATIMACQETNRGCPYSCTFCDWGMATMAKLRRFSEERVKAEFEWVSRNKIQGIILNDANFGILPRDVGLTEYLADLKSRTGFPHHFYPLGLAKNNKDRAFAINKLIINNGFDPFEMNVNFSLQATSQTTLDSIHRQNIPLDNYRTLADRYAKEGYKLTPDLILPLPGETLESFQEGYADLASWEHVTRIRVYPCGVLPNAPMACPDYREKWGIVTRMVPLGQQTNLDLDKNKVEVEMIETVVSTSTMSETEHARAKVFVALINSLEVCGLCKVVRQVVCSEKDWSVATFYTELWTHQVQIGGVLANALKSLEAPVLDRTYGDELIGSAPAKTHDGKTMKAYKVLSYDLLTRAGRATEEFRDFVKYLGIQTSDEFVDYQADLWEKAQ